MGCSLFGRRGLIEHTDFGLHKQLLKQCAVPAMHDILAKDSVQRAEHMFLSPNPKGVQPCWHAPQPVSEPIATEAMLER